MLSFKKKYLSEKRKREEQEQTNVAAAAAAAAATTGSTTGTTSTPTSATTTTSTTAFDQSESSTIKQESSSLLLPPTPKKMKSEDSSPLPMTPNNNNNNNNSTMATTTNTMMIPSPITPFFNKISSTDVCTTMYHHFLSVLLFELLCNYVCGCETNDSPFPTIFFSSPVICFAHVCDRFFNTVQCVARVTQQTTNKHHQNTLVYCAHTTQHKKSTELERRKNLTAKLKVQERELKDLGERLSTTELQCKQQLETIDFLNRLWNNVRFVCVLFACFLKLKSFLGGYFFLCVNDVYVNIKFHKAFCLFDSLTHTYCLIVSCMCPCIHVSTI